MGERVSWGGRYTIYDEVASGGMATVYLAARLGVDADIPRVVALKKLADQFAKQPEFVAMFLDEAHLAARVRHANVVTTYEFLRTDEGLGIVMDLVVGESLMALTRGHDESPQLPPPFDVSTSIVVGALEGLHAAHEASDDSGRPMNLIHRDVSPHNVLVGLDGVARVIDFGVAKAVGRLQTTDVGVLKGKFAYMSPEQIHGRGVDRRADIYAAGIVLWEALTGRKLFRAKTNEELLTKRTAGTVEIPAPSSLNSAVPPGLDRVVARALSTDPDQRYGSARAMADAIRREHEVADVAVVAAWVRGRSGPKLEMLEAKRRRIEDSLGPTLSEPSHGAPLIMRTSSRPPGTSPVTSTLPVGPRRFAGDIDMDAGSPGGVSAGVSRLELEPVRPPASRVSALAVDRARGSRPSLRRANAAPQGRPYRVAFVLVALLLIVGLGSGVMLRGPALLKARVLGAAAAYGVSLTLDRAELSHGGLVLTGVTAELVGCPDVRLVAAEVDVALDHGGDVEQVTLPGYALSVSGPPSEVATELAAWRKSAHGPLSVSGAAGHVVWSTPAIPDMALEALDVSVTFAAASDSTLVLDTRSLLVNVPRGHMGPWHAHLDSNPTETRARIGFDPSAPDAPPTASLIERRGEGSTWSFDVPRLSTFKVGVPAELLGVASDLGIEVALRAHVSPSSDMLTAEGQVGLYGLPIATGKTAMVPVDLVVSGTVAGDPGKPLALVGAKLGLGKVTSAVSGTVALAAGGVRVQIDAPSGHAAPSALTFDTRDWTTGTHDKAPAGRTSAADTEAK